MELSWLMRLRIAAAFGVGAVLIGILGWPLTAPPTCFEPVSLADGSMSFGGAIILAALAFIAGFIAYFLAWPYGREIAVIAAPAGLSVWAVRSGSVAELMMQKPALEQRQAFLAAGKWEAFFWLAIVFVGFAGVWAAQKIRATFKPELEPQKRPNSKPNVYLNAVIAIIGSVLITQFCITLFARDVTFPDRQLGAVTSQPAGAQIAFAVCVSFGLAGFLVKKFLDSAYICPIIAAALVTPFATTLYIKKDILGYLVEYWPPVFFSNVVVSILPIQMVAFGTLGSIAGYWLAIKYNYWRKHG